MRPEERVMRVFAAWQTSDRSADVLLDEIGRQVGQAIYWERRAIVSQFESLLYEQLDWACQHPEQREIALRAFDVVREVITLVLARQHRDADEELPGFDDFKRVRHRLKLRRLARLFGDDLVTPEVVADTHAPSNRYAGDCKNCGARIGTHEGVIERDGEMWTVRHHVGLCTAKRSLSEIAHRPFHADGGSGST